MQYAQHIGVRDYRKLGLNVCALKGNDACRSISNVGKGEREKQK